VAWQIPSPEELLGEIAEMERVMADAPRDEGIEPHAVDADMVRMTEQTILARGLRYYLAAARHSGTGQIVALTEMAVDQNTPQWGFQQATAVQPAHRGHRLGLLVKIGMLDLLAEREPGVRHIFTGNAGSNEHMVAINELLGYRAAATSRSWELDLTRS
jgi:RimJ/RimL family protein N-acetyltransferase